MKIYNKKMFASGMFMMALGTVNLIADMVNQTVDINGTILVAALYAFGIGAIIHSLSQKRTKEDRLEELDERNQLIALKAKSKAFALTHTISFVLMLAMLIMGKVAGSAVFVAIGIGLALTFVISMVTELLTFMYYEEKN